MRGENSKTVVENGKIEGTSPRARGKPLAAYSFRGLERNIPACAGKTTPTLSTTDLSEEHPRVRGENFGT